MDKAGFTPCYRGSIVWCGSRDPGRTVGTLGIRGNSGFHTSSCNIQQKAELTILKSPLPALGMRDTVDTVEGGRNMEMNWIDDQDGMDDGSHACSVGPC